MTDVILTPEQAAIVGADCAGPRLVDAGAGTGKTFTMVERARALIAAGLPADALLVVTFTKAAANEIAGRLEAVLDRNDPRRPMCGTFHGIAHTLLREFAYETGISPDLRVIDDGRARGVFARAFRDLEAGRLDVDLGAFPLVDRPRALERSLATIALDLKARGIAVPTFRTTALTQADALAELPFGAVAKVGKRGKATAGWPRPDPPRSVEERRAEAANERRNIEVVATLFTRFGDLLDAAGLLTFGDVIIAATTMLREHAEIAARVGARWQHAIVDEFQDTNETQIALLEAICGPDLRPVLVVGDVRQAIYEFNGAQPQGIVDFRARAIETLPLGENRRSLQPILDVAQHALTTLTLGAYAGDGVVLRAERGATDPRAVRVESFDGPDPRAREAAAVAVAVRRLIDDGVAPRDIALLMRGRRRNHVYADALHAQGVATQLRGGVGFFDAPEIREVTSWVRLAVDPNDAYAIVAALQSAAINLGDGAVALLAAGGDLPRGALIEPAPAGLDAAARVRLERFRETARLVTGLGDVPLLEGVRTILRATGAEFARLGQPEIRAQVRANLDQFLRLASDLSNDVPTARLRDLIAELDERDALDLDLPLAQLEGDRVALLTIHGAKGLEWTHVFIVDVAPSAFPVVTNDMRELVARLDANGALALKHGADARPTLRWYCTQNEHDAKGIVAETQRDLSEEHRLLYVALTRARDRVTVTGRRDIHGNTSRCLNAVEAWITACGYDLAAHRLAADDGSPPASGLTPPATSIDTAVRSRMLARIERIESAARHAPASARRRGTLSYSAMEMQQRCPRRARYHYVLGLPDLTDGAPSPWSGTGRDDREERDPARFGRIVHKILEYDALARIEPAERDLGRFVADAREEEDGTQADAIAAHAAARAAIATLEQFEPVEAELHFTIDFGDVPLGGYIDLLARDEAGRLVVIDYKTGQTPREHYALQFALYAHAIRETYGEIPRTIVLRIGAGAVGLERVQPATDAELSAAIDAARGMESDEPLPGPGCRSCPYAHDVCRAAPVPG